MYRHVLTISAQLVDRYSQCIFRRWGRSGFDDDYLNFGELVTLLINCYHNLVEKKMRAGISKRLPHKFHIPTFH